MSGYQPQGYDPRQQRPVTPPQWQRSAPPPYSPNPALTGYTDHLQAPTASQRKATPPVPHPARRRPLYPYHLVRFPDEAIPGSRRSRGPSVWRVLYLGRHPVALLIGLWLFLVVAGAVCAWIVLVALAWALWTAAVTIAWLFQVAAARLRR